MDTSLIVHHIDAAIRHDRKARRLLIPVAPPSETIPVHAGDALQPIIDAALDYAVLDIEPATYPGSIVLHKPITLQSRAARRSGRATATSAGVEILGSGNEAITVTGPYVTLHGIGGRNDNPSGQIIGVVGAAFAMDYCTLLGHADQGQHRGLMLQGDGAVIEASFIDDCFSIGRDAQAISGWDGTHHVLIDDCHLGGGAQSIMFGGGDSTSADRMPTDITVTRCLLTKNPRWFDLHAQIKCALELKCVNGFVMTDCTLEYAGISEGQSAYVIVLSVRNQDGGAPWSTVRSVTIQRCLGRYGGGAINIAGSDNEHPSGTMDDVLFEDVCFTDIDPAVWKGAGKGVQFQMGPEHVTLRNITLDMKNMGSNLYLIPPPLTGLVLQNLKMTPSEYGGEEGMKIDAGGSGQQAWKDLMPDAIIDITPDDTGASGYPTA
jgi:hypothetical protein